MANFTPNYNLKKPVVTENYNVEDQNGNMESIDQALSPTADPALVPAGVAGKLNQWVSWFTNRIKAITGKPNWYDAPATTLEATKTHIENYSYHTIRGNAGGSATAYTITVPEWANQTGARHGMEMDVQFSYDCGNSPTLNVNGWGAKPIVVEPLTAYTRCVAGDIVAEYIYTVMYHTSPAAWVVKGVRLNKFNAHLADMVTDADGAHGLKVESGTFTPYLAADTVSGTHTYTYRSGTYVKINKLIFIDVKLSLSTKDPSMTGIYSSIRGIPFTPNQVYSLSVSNFSNITLDASRKTLLAHTETTGIYPTFSGDNLSTNGVPSSSWNNTSIIWISGIYCID